MDWGPPCLADLYDTNPLPGCGREIGEDYKDKHVVVIGVMKGGFMFTAGERGVLPGRLIDVQLAQSISFVLVFSSAIARGNELSKPLPLATFTRA